MIIGKLSDFKESEQRKRLEVFTKKLQQNGYKITNTIERHGGYRIYVEEIKDGWERFDGVTADLKRKTFFLAYYRRSRLKSLIISCELFVYFIVVVLCLYILLFINPNRYTLFGYLPLVSYM